MILPKFKYADRQGRLFDAPKLIKSTGELRWAVGEFFEELTATITSARRLRTDSRAPVCPDLQFSPDTFFEVKGVGKTNKVILYSGRQTKYAEFIGGGYRVDHWIWTHNFRASNTETYPDLYSALARHTRQLLIVDFDFLQEQCTGAARVINSQYNKQHKGNGYSNNELYGTGWFVPIRLMQTLCFRRAELFSCGGRYPIAGVEVFCSNSRFENFL